MRKSKSATFKSARYGGLDLTRQKDHALIDRLAAWQQTLNDQMVAGLDKPIELCSEILGRTGGLRDVTDDNMGTEWRHFLTLDE